MNQDDPAASTCGDDAVPLAPESLVRLNQYCDRWEGHWRKHAGPWHQVQHDSVSHDDGPSLKDFVRSLPADDQSFTVPELILIDMDYRKKRGRPPSAETYLCDFPWLDPNWLQRECRATQGSEFSNPRPIRQENPAGEQLGDYLIQGSLGQGGMGQVYRAVHKLMGRVVALKVMRQTQTEDPVARRRFEREVQTLAQLSHPNIVTAFDAREQDQVLYLVTELIEGQDLARLVARQGPLPPGVAADYGWQAANGLAYAHQRGIIHRDVKPSNLILDQQGTIKVLDLGLARLRSIESSDDGQVSTLTDSGKVMGTAQFMAPEQARSPLDADERSDIYSLGCTLYFLLTGEPPFQGQSEIDTILAHLQQPVPHLPATIQSHPIPAPLAKLIQDMMAKSPDCRPASMTEVMPRLKPLAQSRPTQLDAACELLSGEKSAPGSAIQSKDHSYDLSPSKPVRWLIPVTAALVILSLLAIAVAAVRWRHEFAARPVSFAAHDDGLQFDGRQSYGRVTDFDLPLTTPFRLQVAAIPHRHDAPANLISWTGDNWAALFLTTDGKWGIGWRESGQTHMVVTRQPARFDQLQVVVGQWDGRQLQMFLDGQPMPTEVIDFNLPPMERGLYFGGAPPGMLLDSLGERYFRGSILAIRIEMDSLSEPVASTREQLLRVTPGTVVLFPFSEGDGDVATDRTSAGWQARLVQTSWIRDADDRNQPAGGVVEPHQ